MSIIQSDREIPRSMTLQRVESLFESSKCPSQSTTLILRSFEESTSGEPEVEIEYKMQGDLPVGLIIKVVDENGTFVFEAVNNFWPKATRAYLESSLGR